LRSPITPGMATLDVAAGSVSRTTSIAFVALAREQIFDASVSQTSIPADGFSTTVITVRLRRFDILQQRTVTVETSAGVLIAIGQQSSRTVTVTADSTGKAEVELQSEKTAGTARVRVTSRDVLQEFAITFTPVEPAQIITVTTERSSAPADGVTPLGVSARVASGLPAGRRTVTFRSTLGQLIPMVIEADGSNVAHASLISGTTGMARITATVDGTTAKTTAEFSVALPDRLYVSSDAATLRSGESTTIHVTLIRSAGTVSPNLRVSYSARTGTGASFGSFSAVTLAQNSVSTAAFHVGTTTFLGSITVKASVDGGATSSITLKIVP
jgi:hypothetical protein